jgi:molybdopterin molybdotransferase
LKRAREADVLVTIGGASVGDHDHMRPAFLAAGGEMIFSKVSVKPGKPTWFGSLHRTRVLGLPGNPASALVCAHLFLRPLISAMAGAGEEAPRFRAALKGTINANGPRESYLRARIEAEAAGRLVVSPFRNQDSSLLTPLAEGNCLIRRRAEAPAAADGELVDCLLLSPFGGG